MQSVTSWASYLIHKIAGCACAGNTRNVSPPPPPPPPPVFKGNRSLAIPACITARAWRTCRDACRDRLLAKTFPPFPAHAHPQFWVSGKRPIACYHGWQKIAHDTRAVVPCKQILLHSYLLSRVETDQTLFRTNIITESSLSMHISHHANC